MLKGVRGRRLVCQLAYEEVERDLLRESQMERVVEGVRGEVEIVVGGGV